MSKKNKQKYTIYILTKNRSIYNEYKEKGDAIFMINSLLGWMISLKAMWFVTDHGMSDINIYATNGANILLLWHGMPMKRIGIDDNHFYNRNSILSHLNNIICPYYNNKSIYSLISTSDFFVPFLSSGFAHNSGKLMEEDKIIYTGLPRTDMFFNTNKMSDIISNIRIKFNNPQIIFYLPTFRKSIYDDTTFNPFQDYKFNEDNLIKILHRKNMVFLYKPHPLEGKICIKNNGRFLQIVDDDGFDLYLTLKDIDILITDYSSVYFDFLLLKKPIILAPFDYEYYSNIRGFYYDYNEYIQGIKVYNWEQLFDCLENKTYYYPDTKDLFNKYNDGKSCERIFNLIEQS
jgi:CDP-glycerol glycerophosphotransferase